MNMIIIHTEVSKMVNTYTAMTALTLAVSDLYQPRVLKRQTFLNHLSKPHHNLVFKI